MGTFLVPPPTCSTSGIRTFNSIISLRLQLKIFYKCCYTYKTYGYYIANIQFLSFDWTLFFRIPFYSFGLRVFFLTRYFDYTKTEYEFCLSFILQFYYISKVIIFFCIPESFNTNILHQLFDYKITFLNSQKGNFVLKNWLKPFAWKISVIKKFIRVKNIHFCLKFFF